MGRGTTIDATARTWWQDYRKPTAEPSELARDEVRRLGDYLACRYLTRRGIRITEQDWECEAGAIPIVGVEEDGQVVLAEVRATVDETDADSMPELRVSDEDQRLHRRLALTYLIRHPEVDALRLDVLAVEMKGRHQARLRHMIGALEWESCPGDVPA